MIMIKDAMHDQAVELLEPWGYGCSDYGILMGEKQTPWLQDAS
jgi:hypothetical protein